VREGEREWHEKGVKSILEFNLFQFTYQHTTHCLKKHDGLWAKKWLKCEKRNVERGHMKWEGPKGKEWKMKGQLLNTTAFA